MGRPRPRGPCPRALGQFRNCSTSALCRYRSLWSPTSGGNAPRAARRTCETDRGRCRAAYRGQSTTRKERDAQTRQRRCLGDPAGLPQVSAAPFRDDKLQPDPAAVRPKLGARYPAPRGAPVLAIPGPSARSNPASGDTCNAFRATNIRDIRAVGGGRRGPVPVRFRPPGVRFRTERPRARRQPPPAVAVTRAGSRRQSAVVPRDRSSSSPRTRPSGWRSRTTSGSAPSA